MRECKRLRVRVRVQVQEAESERVQDAALPDRSITTWKSPGLPASGSLSACPAEGSQASSPCTAQSNCTTSCPVIRQCSVLSCTAPVEDVSGCQVLESLNDTARVESSTILLQPAETTLNTRDQPHLTDKPKLKAKKSYLLRFSFCHSCFLSC